MLHMKLFDEIEAEVKQAPDVKAATAALVRTFHKHLQLAGNDDSKLAQLRETLAQRDVDLSDLVATKPLQAEAQQKQLKQS
jgi:hypothetical protein